VQIWSKQKPKKPVVNGDGPVANVCGVNKGIRLGAESDLEATKVRRFGACKHDAILPNTHGLLVRHDVSPAKDAAVYDPG